MAEKATTMVLTVVDLQCTCCYRKVKKLLCKFPEIRDQTYDEKQNTVTITVVCCSPERIRDKLYCKGRKIILCIKIVDPKFEELTKKAEELKKKAEELEKRAKKLEQTANELEKKDKELEQKAKELEKMAKELGQRAKNLQQADKALEERAKKLEEWAKELEQRANELKKKEQELEKKVMMLAGKVCPSGCRGPCCEPCSEWSQWGACPRACGKPVPCYDGCYAYGGGSGRYVSRCDYYCQENAAGCTIM